MQFSLFGVFWSSLSLLGFMAEFSYYCCLLTKTQLMFDVNGWVHVGPLFYLRVIMGVGVGA